MEKINKFHLRTLFTTLLMAFALFRVSGQTTMPDVLLKNTLKEQLNYLDEHTRIYENYRAIREDMFQQIKGNISDTLSKAFGRINLLNGSVAALNRKIDTLTARLETTKASLDEMSRTKNSIKLLGIEVNKVTYNSMMWLIIAGLAACLVIGFLIFKRNLYSIHHLNKDLSELKSEFDAYRKSAREAREKMSMEHFNEIKRLKGG